MTVLPLNSGKPRVSMTFRVVRTNQYNQDLGLIHSTNGNHLGSPKEGSSIDHQTSWSAVQKKSGSSSSGSGSSSSGGSSKVEFCGQCGGRNPTVQCVGVQGSCNVCGQYGHFARVCPFSGSQHPAAPPQS
ncbi:hypothetical protein F511_30929 [Dorcoceras hygrometricum]|uniref:CCHC-type domain-containing protein n=1 Tax=Dorcoceras hygrometricum TaxID=472368 RepID=A0A2Z7AFP2_9LAMI|nr:hypothetical protein F511_30929 [Dorcoceras hygrometricum]